METISVGAQDLILRKNPPVFVFSLPLSHTGMMTGDENSLFNLKLIKRRDLGEQETKIINAFACGVQPATEESAAEAVRQLDSYCPPLEQYDEVGDYLWMVWEILMDIVQSPDVTGEVHDQLIVILGSLWQCAKGEVDVYGVSISLPFPINVAFANYCNSR